MHTFTLYLRRCGLGLTCLLTCLLGIVLSARQPGAQFAAGEPAKETSARDLPALLKARAALAEKSYQQVFRLFGETKKVDNRVMIPAHPQEVYTWSLRWLDAERDLSAKDDARFSAYRAHLTRMTELQNEVKRMVPDLLHPREATDTEWYKLEAEVWLAQQKDKQKPPR